MIAKLALSDTRERVLVVDLDKKMMAMSRALLAATAALALFADVVIGESDMVLELHGSGTTNPSRFIANVSLILWSVIVPVELQYISSR